MIRYMAAISETDKAYLAGFIDADGSIGIHKLGPYPKTGQYCISYFPVVQLCGSNREILEWAQGIYGGHFTKRRSRWGEYPVYYWICVSQQARALIEDILPYLRLKLDHAYLALELQDRKDDRSSGRVRSGRAGQPRLSDDELAIRANIYEQMKRLNLRGKARKEAGLDA
jgi:hypothetical protein